MSVDNNQFLSHEQILIEEGLDVRFSLSVDSGSYVSSHWHNAIEIIYLLSGELDVIIDNCPRHLVQNDVVLINSKVIHSTKCLKSNEAILLQLPYSFVKKYIPDIGSITFDLNSQSPDPVKEVLHHLQIVYQCNLDGATLRFNSLLFELLYLLYHDFRTLQPIGNYKKHSKTLHLLEPILDYTNNHYNQPITITEISSIASFQPEYFCRFFKKNMGITYLEYLNEVRLSHIYHDLRTTDYPINYLLEIHGFTNYKLFSRMFHEKFGNTPGKIRSSITP